MKKMIQKQVKSKTTKKNKLGEKNMLKIIHMV